MPLASDGGWLGLVNQTGQLETIGCLGGGRQSQFEIAYLSDCASFGTIKDQCGIKWSGTVCDSRDGKCQVGKSCIHLQQGESFCVPFE